MLSFWGPEQNGVFQNDFFCVGRTAKSPVLAHHFLNFMLDEQIAYDNFVNFTGYVPPQKAIDAEALIDRGLIPPTLTGAVLRPGPVPPQPGPPPAEHPGRAGLGPSLVEVHGRVDAIPLDLAAARAPRAWPGWRLFFLVAFYAIVCVAFGNQNTLYAAGPVLEPARLERRLRLQALEDFWDRRPVPDRLRAHDRVTSRSRWCLSLLIGYPVAYFTARHAGRWKWIVLLVLLVLPFWINYLMRMFAWINLLVPRRLGHAAPARLRDRAAVHRARAPLDRGRTGSAGQSSTVIIALVYGYVPFLILPLFAAARPDRPAPDRSRARPRRQPVRARSAA